MIQERILINCSQFKEILLKGVLLIDGIKHDFTGLSIFGSNSIILNKIQLTETCYFGTQVTISKPLIFVDVRTDFGIFLDEASISSIRFSNGIYDNISIKGNGQTSLIISGGQFNHLSLGGIFTGVFIEDFTSKKMTFDNVSLSNLDINGGQSDLIFFSEYSGDNKYDSINIKGGDFKSTLFSSIFIDKLTIKKNIPSNNSIAFEKTCIKKLLIHETTNYGKITINSIIPHPEGNTIEIQNTTLGNLDLISVDLSSYKLTISSSKIVDVFYTNLLFPKHINTISTTRKGRLNAYTDLFEQLSLVSSKRGDRYNMLRFQSLSLEALYRSTKKFTSDWWLLAIYKYSNNFRQDWIRGVIFTLLFGFLFYLFFITVTEKGLYFGLYSLDESLRTALLIFKKRGTSFFEFINPIHKINDFENSKDFNMLAYFIDYICRIFTGFGIYQTVQAFRKYGKSTE